MSTLYRLKAYFGMVPTDELDDYGNGEFDREYDADYERAGYRSDRSDRADRAAGRRPVRWTDRPERAADADDFYEDDAEPIVRRPPAAQPRRSWPADAPVRGALAVDPAREVVTRTAPAEAVAPTPEVHPMSRITTLHPQNYAEARTIGEHYREGIPVIMNLTALEDGDARRLVDFAAGLAFALRGSIDKVTTKVFLISPANVDVTAEDKRRIAEGSFLPPHFNRS